MARESSGKDAAGRRERAAALKAEQDRRERRQKLIIWGVAGVLVLAVVVGSAGAILFSNANKLSNKSFSQLGVPLADASCQAPITDPISGVGQHIGPGTNQPDLTHVDYTTVPPSSGAHLAVPVFPSQGFYTTHDVPQVEKLVHNLEHGYTVVWYDPSLPQDQQDVLRDIATKMRINVDKFIVAPWDTTRGTFAGGAKVAMSHWGAKSGYRQLCGAVSGAAIEAFVNAHPVSDSPEPNAV